MVDQALSEPINLPKPNVPIFPPLLTLPNRRSVMMAAERYDALLEGIGKGFFLCRTGGEERGRGQNRQSGS